MELKLLEEIGLTKSEIKVYLALLELGSSSTGPIVDKSGAASSKIYEILDRLMQKGLASYVIKAGTKYFEAADPKRLLDYMQEKEQQLKKQEQELTKLLPELELKRTLSKEKSETLVFKGMKGAETAFNDILTTLKKGEEMIAIGFSDVHQQFQNFLINFHKKRAKLSIRARKIFGESLRSMVEEINKQPYTKIKVVPTQKDPVAILVYKDKTLFSLAWDYLWIQVKNKRLADAFRNNFEALWDETVHITKGMKGMETAFNDVLKVLKKGETNHVYVVGKIDEPMNEFFKKHYALRAKKGIKTKTIFSEEGREHYESRKNIPNFEGKVIGGLPSPATVNVYGNKVNIRMGDSKDVVSLVIGNKHLADSFLEQFKMMWNQKVHAFEGVKDVTLFFRNILKELKQGDEYWVLNPTYGLGEPNKKLLDFFLPYHKKRAKKGIKVNFLVSTKEKRIKPLLEIQPISYKYLPPNFESPLQVAFYKNKLYIWIAQKNPVGFLIESKEAVDAFKSYFELLWNAKT